MRFDLTHGRARMFDRMLSLDGSVAAVTGGGSGIGEVAAMAFACAGAEVHVLDFNETGGRRTVERIAALPDAGKANFIKLDVTDGAWCKEAIDSIATRTGRLDIVFTCAGVTGRDESMSEAERIRMPKVNVDGTINVCEAAVPYMVARRHGRVITMGSVVGFPHVEFSVGKLYKDSKEKVHEYTKALALRVGADNVTANSLAPGRVLTPMVVQKGIGWVAKDPNPVEAFRRGCSTQRLGRMLVGDEVAAAALFLCSPLAAMINGVILDLSNCWAIGHTPWKEDDMPEAFVPFRDGAQLETETVISPAKVQ